MFIRIGLKGLALTLGLAACGEPPPPEGIVQPAAVSGPTDVVAPASLPGASPTHRLVGLRITLENPPEELLDERGAGVIEMMRTDTRETARLVFLNGALTAHALAPGPWRIRAISAQHCGFLDLAVPPGDRAMAAGDLVLTFPPGAEIGAAATLTGDLPRREDIETFAELHGAQAEEIDARPLLRPGPARDCRHYDRVVTRPDVDPMIEVLTPLQIAQMVVLGALFGAATGGAAATGSVVFVSGGGGLLFLGI